MPISTTNSAGASSAQAVDVAAVNTATDFSFAGAIAGACSCGDRRRCRCRTLNNSTTAYIGDDAVVDAKQDVDVFALSSDAVQSYGLSGGIATVAASGVGLGLVDRRATSATLTAMTGNPGSALPAGGICA